MTQRTVGGFAAIIPPEVWNRLLAAGNRRTFAPGQVVMRQGEPGDHVVLVMDGRVKVTRVDPDGNRLVLAVRGAGELLGEIGLLGGDTRSATVTAIDACDTRAIPSERFAELITALKLEGDMFRHLIRRLREGETRRAELAALPSGRRVARCLLHLVEGITPDPPEGPGPHEGIDVGLNQTDLADAAGLHRSTVAAELRRLREQEVVATSRGHILVVDLPRLRERS